MKRFIPRLIAATALTLAAMGSAVVAGAPAAHAEPMCAPSMNSTAFVGTYRLVSTAPSGLILYSSNLVLNQYNAATEIGNGATAYGSWYSDYLWGDYPATCSVTITSQNDRGEWSTCSPTAAPRTNGTKVTSFTSVCRASSGITRYFTATRI